MRTAFLLAILSCAALMAQTKEAARAFQQRAQTTAQIATSEMKKIQFMVGEWKGEGTAFVRNNRIPTTVTQSARSNLKGKVLSIEVEDHTPFPSEVQGGL